MNTKGIITVVLLGFIVVAAFWTFSNKAPVVDDGVETTPIVEPVSAENGEVTDPVDEPVVENALADSVEVMSDGIVVLYLYGDVRCSTCIKFEEYTSHTMETYYASAIEDGSVQWVTLNADDDEHKHYKDRYELYTKALIISERIAGEEVRWKDLKDIWTKVSDEEVFSEYVTSEIDAWLEEGSYLMYFLAAISAFWLGVVTSISPCPLATNVAAISFIARKLDSTKSSLSYSIAYTIGRMLAYLLIGVIVVAGLLAIPAISDFLQKHMNQILGIVLIFVGMFLLEMLTINIGTGMSGEKFEKYSQRWGLAGAVMLGFIFALSFCPVTAAWFFGSLIPLAVKHNSILLFPLLFGIGTALPVVIFGVLIATGARSVGSMFDKFKKVEVIVRRITGVVFILVGIYYCLVYIFGIQFIRGAS